MVCLETVPVTTISKNGQVVIPEKIRSSLRVLAGMRFAVFASGDTIFLKRIDVPSPEQAFKELHEWGVKYAKKKGLKEEDVMEKIQKGRDEERRRKIKN